jgi:hypothetical protein
MKWRTLPKVGICGFRQEHHKEQNLNDWKIKNGMMKKHIKINK